MSENCVLFGLSKPRFDGLEALVEDFVSVSKSWDILKTYYDELNVISEQDWLTFSVNVYVLQDFSSKWSEQLKGYKLDNISEHILTSVEKIKKRSFFILFLINRFYFYYSQFSKINKMIKCILFYIILYYITIIVFRV